MHCPILCCSLASIFGLFVIFVAAVFTLNLRRSRRQVRGQRASRCAAVLTCCALQEEGLASSSSAHSRPETVYITACVWLFIPAAVTRCVLLFISAFSSRCVQPCVSIHEYLCGGATQALALTLLQ